MFVLALAALATVVTVIIESTLRILGVRKKNLVDLPGLLNNRLRNRYLTHETSSLTPAPVQRWQLIGNVVINPDRIPINQQQNQKLPDVADLERGLAKRVARKVK